MNNYARTGGILSIISGIFSICPILVLALLVLALRFMPTPAKDSADFTSAILCITIALCIIALLLALLGALAITGGIFATKGKHWGWAMAGAIASEWLLYPCGVVAVILTSLAKDKFTSGKLNTSMEGSSADSATLPATKSEPNKTRTAGILTIIAGVMGVLNLGMAFINVSLMNVLSNPDSMFHKTFSANYLNFQNIFYIIYGTVSAIFGIMALAGGIIAFRKKHWKLAMTGSIAGIFAFWPCGIAGTILMSMAKEEFNKSEISTRTFVDSD